MDADPPDDVASGVAKIKRPHGSHRITPPKDVREDVRMRPDEPWVWYWNDPTAEFVIRRMGIGVDDWPDAKAVATAFARKNGEYIDFAIPPLVVDFADMTEGEPWRVSVSDGDTMVAKRTQK